MTAARLSEVDKIDKRRWQNPLRLGEVPDDKIPFFRIQFRNGVRLRIIDVDVAPPVGPDATSAMLASTIVHLVFLDLATKSSRR